MIKGLAATCAALTRLEWKDIYMNPNMVIIGAADSEKTIVLKDLLLQQYSKGARVMVIDPEREYRDICNKVGGEWIDFSTYKPVKDFTVFDSIDIDMEYILPYIWNLIKRGINTEKRTFLAIDGISPRTPELIRSIRNIQIRTRPCNAALIFTVQSAADFLAPEIARWGQSLLTSPSQKFLMRQEGKDLEALRTLMDLSEAETDLLANAKRGEGLLITEDRREYIKIGR